jgi:hypothetical protein
LVQVFLIAWNMSAASDAASWLYDFVLQVLQAPPLILAPLQDHLGQDIITTIIITTMITMDILLF